MQSFRGSTQQFILSGELTKGLRDLSQREGVTLFMTLLGAFQVLLSRYTGQKDIIVGSPIANRNRSEIEGLIGFFVNTLALRTDLSGNPSFTELLRRVKKVTLGAYTCQDLPFEMLVEELQPVRDMSRSPLFQVFFNMTNVNLLDSRGILLTGLKVETVVEHDVGSKFDLTVYAGEQNDTVQFNFVYDADLFEDVTIAWMQKHFMTLLEGLVSNPDRPVTVATLITDSERDRLVKCRNLVCPINQFVEFTKEEIEQSIPDRFDKQAKRYPKNIAVKTKDYEYTYEELNRASILVSKAVLARCGSGGGRIALLFEHGAQMIIGILGALKAGKTYIPLDPFYPKGRLSYIREDSEADAILTNNMNLSLARELTKDGLVLINIDDIASVHVGNSIPFISPDTVAYILYTSGSTGKPKGVMQNHRNVLHHIRNYTNNLHINQDDRLTLFSSYSFDAAVMDIFGALLNGATVYPINIREEGPDILSPWLVKHEITLYHSTPTVYRYFMAQLNDADEFPAIRLVVLGGEEVVKRDVDLYKKHFSSACIFVNGLGPTESTVSLQYFINKEMEIIRNSVPVGYPVENTEVFLLDAAEEDTAIYGEVCIRSRHVALGYWQEAERTAAVFLSSRENDGKIIYRTGDMGRYLPNGSIEFAGRKDMQVKIRGYRIEPGEVEAILMELPSVKEAVVIAREYNPGEKQLVAFVVSRPEQQLIVSNIRDLLKEKLPDYMIPSFFVFLDVLPLMPNGKVDRKALPTPDGIHAESEKKFVVPRTPTEEIIAGIWGEILRNDRIGIHDNFFELGGHSLLATQVISRIKKMFEVSVPLRSLFDRPTVSELAEGVETIIGTKQEAAVLPIHLVSREGKLPLSFGQQRMWFLDQLQPNSPLYNLPVTVRLKGKLDVEAIEQVFAEIVRRHETLRTTFAPAARLPEQVIASELALPVFMRDLSGLPEEERLAEALRLAREEAQQPFDLVLGPLIRVALLQLKEEEHLLLVTMHHIVSDGWSIGILARELSALYNAFSTGLPSPLPDLPIQYADFAVWQRQYMQGEVLERQMLYWRDQLGGELPVLELPTDRPRPAVQSFRGSTQQFILSGELTKGLRDLSQ
ncbi:MAG: amino acid adenylation domain-containing protein, partial [Thermodesulfovibrionales bacterium]